ncbi:ribbon-helix-helix domain-containing protein [Novosphingobium beihaiensis]|uniref:Type II toxin-antitoxin system ParD family antitoxin n=1 Tax=Novosphingobium beihaiensis TaxID=2930389 RepID=A0ABT0BSE5_9SPHN|nr:type II toxin-antitoxin system ParD family antitoxin [Novosphingobium beihaiensis]MCJ2187890.1 type II toxin-antitoxin system ParD family antitoxin [Novosphingobium beihaiensis]
MEKASITITDAHFRLAQDAIKAGEYASLSEVIREAMREWEYKRERREAALESLRRDVDEALADRDAGRMSEFDPDDIIMRGRERLKSS